MPGTAFALFDFDDTLAKGDSVLPYLLYCVKRGAAPWYQLPRAMLGYIRWLLNPACASGAKKTSLSFMKGKTRAEMDDLARDFFRDQQSRRFYQDGLKELWRLRGEGYHILIVSASADVYMRVLPEFLPVDGVLSTTCAVDRQGRYTGDVGDNCKGDEKPRRIAAYLQSHGLSLDPARSRGYGDSPSDAPMLAMTATQTLVNPKKKLRQLLPEAQQVSWH